MRADGRMTLMFSATFPVAIQNLAKSFMRPRPAAVATSACDCTPETFCTYGMNPQLIHRSALGQLAASAGRRVAARRRVVGTPGGPSATPRAFNFEDGSGRGGAA